MSPAIPLLRLGDCILVSLQGDLDDGTALQVEADLTRDVARSGARGVLLDVSGLEIVDSFIAQILARVVAMVRLLGAEVVVVGMQPTVAITLVELGVPMGRLPTALDAGQGLERVRRLRGHSGAMGRRAAS